MRLAAALLLAAWLASCPASCLVPGAALAQGAGPAPSTPGGPFTFTVPQSRVVVKVADASLLPDTAAAKPNYFKLTRRDPLLIVSGWLEPAERYKGLDALWEEEKRAPVYAGPLAPVRVETLREGPWEVVAFDVALPGGTQSNLRAERVMAGTWIDLHISTASTRPSATLRAELRAALRKVEVVQK
jgi:hypothetical protein